MEETSFQRLKVLRSRLLTPEQAAEVLGVKPATLQKWRTARRYALRFVKVGRSVRYRCDDLEAFLNRAPQRREHSASRRRRRRVQ